MKLYYCLEEQKSWDRWVIKIWADFKNMSPQQEGWVLESWKKKPSSRIIKKTIDQFCRSMQIIIELQKEKERLTPTPIYSLSQKNRI